MTKGHAKYSYALKAELGKSVADLKSKAKTKKEQRGVYPKAVRRFFPDLKSANI